MTTEKMTEKMIDVAEEFHCPHQADSYHEAYRAWRRLPDNPYAYAYTKHPKEAAFSENPSVLPPSRAMVEKTVLQRISMLIASAMLLYYAAENILDKLLIAVLNAAGFRIDFVFLEYTMFGDEQAGFLVVSIISFLKYGLPAVFLLWKLRMPAKVALPMKVRQPSQLLAGMALTMLLSAGLGTFLVPRSSELKKYEMLLDSVSSSDSFLFLYEVLTIFLLPIVIELFLHGVMFQVLRQFGDAFAIGITTAVSMMLMHTPSDILRVGIITLTISYYMVQTGSFSSAVVLHIIHEIYMFALYYLEAAELMPSLLWWLVILLPCVMGVVVLLHRAVAKPHHDSHGVQSTCIDWTDRTAIFFSVKPMLLMMVLSILTIVVVVTIV